MNNSNLTQKEKTIIELYRAGTKPALVASAACVSTPYVYKTIKKAKAAGIDVPDTYRKGTKPVLVRLRLTDAALYDLEREAAKRSLTVEAFCAVLIQTISAEKLYTAVIDDEGEG